MSKHEYSARTYSVVPYDQEWPKSFQSVRDALVPVFGDVAERIEHVGSTAVPGMASKPTIDILVVAHDITAIDTLNPKMAELGYTALGEYVAKGGRLFAKERNGDRLVNIHCFPPDHPKMRQLLAWREYLLTHPDEQMAYAKLKQDLYQKYPTDYGAYRKEKDEYMAGLNQRAEAWWSSEEL